MLARLRAWQDGETLAVEGDGRRFFAPATADELARLLLEHPEATVLAGGTDVGLWVTKLHRRLETVIYVGRVRELAEVRESDDAIEIGAGVTYRDATAALAGAWPDMGEVVRRLGSVQIRNCGTIGGNIANGSPIGDSAAAPDRAGATLVLRARRRAPRDAARGLLPRLRQAGPAAGRVRREGDRPQARGRHVLPLLQDHQALRPGHLGRAARAFRIGARRRARRRRPDRLRRHGGDAEAGAPPPRRRSPASRSTEETVEAAVEALATDFAPISDMRASADYRMRGGAEPAAKVLRSRWRQRRPGPRVLDGRGGPAHA